MKTYFIEQPSDRDEGLVPYVISSLDSSLSFPQIALQSYHRFHFDDSPILGSVPNLSVQMAKICVEMCRRHFSGSGDLSDRLALDAGAGPGRVGIELAKVFGSVECFDYSHPFVAMMKAKVSECI